MKTYTLTELRRDPLAALKALRKGHVVRITRRTRVVEEIQSAGGLHLNPRFDSEALKRNPLPMPRPLKRGELGVVALLKQDRDER